MKRLGRIYKKTSCYQRKTGVWFLVILFAGISSGICMAGDMSLRNAGVRYGTNDGLDEKTDLRRYEAFGVMNLPWSWQITSGIDLDTVFVASAGLLDGEGDQGFIGTLTPGISFTDKRKRFFFELAGGITIVPDYELGEEDFGGPLQFTFGGGIGFRLFNHLELGYKIQHFSDASIFGEDNRGVDWHLFEFSYRYSGQ